MKTLRILLAPLLALALALPARAQTSEIFDLTTTSSAAGNARVWIQLSPGGAGTDRAITLDNLMVGRSITLADGDKGAISISSGVWSIDDGAVTMAKIAQAGATSGQAIAWNGSAWAPATVSGGSGSQTPWAQNIAGAGFSLSGAGTVAATLFSGSGASLTSLPAANLTGTLPAISGANLTALNATNIASGSLALARVAQGGAATGQLLGWNGTAWAPTPFVETIQAAATYSTSGDTTLAGGNWFHAATLSSGTYARNIILNPSSVSAGQRAEIYIDSSTGTQNLKIWNSVASGTALFDFTATSTAAARGLAKFINSGSAWIVAGPNVMHEYGAVASSDPADESPTSFAGLTTPARRYSAASLKALANDDPVTSWVDLSGNSATAAQATGGNQPTKTTTGAYNAVLFDGTDDFLDFTSLTTGGDDYTVIAVIDAVTVTNGAIVGDDTEPAQPLAIGDYGGNALGIATIATNGTGAERSGAMTLTSRCVISVRVSNGTAVFKLNGNVVANNANVGTINTATFGRIGDEAGNTAPLGAYLYDVSMFDSAISDVAAIEAALMSHYGL